MDKLALAWNEFWQKKWVRKVISFAQATLPYLLLLAVSFLPFVVWFKNPEYLTNGDDITWHRVYVYDLVYGWKNGFSGISTGHTLLGNLGYNIYTFYAPMSHYIVGILNFMGMRIIDAWKLVSILSVFLSGVWTYRLSLQFTKDKGVALALGMAYIFSPYRLYCFLYRAAFSEAFAQAFIPLLLLGVFRILKEEKATITGYLCAVIGGASLILSHPFTALLSGILTVFMVLANFKNLIRIVKQKATWIYLPISLVLLAMIVAFYMIPMQQALKTGYYRMSDEVAVWTSVEHLVTDIKKTEQFAGYLYPVWINYIKDGYPGETETTWTWDIILYLFAACASILTLAIAKKKDKTYLGLSFATIISLLPIFFVTREEMLFAMPLFTLTMVFITLREERIKTSETSLLQNLKNEAKNPEIYVLLVSMVLCLLYLYVPFMWEHSPEILRKCQFPFRFWGVFNMIAVLIALVFARAFSKYRVTKYVALTLSILWYVTAMGPVDKRIVYSNHGGNAAEPDMSMVQSLRNIGVMNEYMPRIFYDTSYKSDYTNSLYNTIRREVLVTRKWQWGAEDYHLPVYLEGTGDVTVTSINSPNGVFQVTVTSEDALLQLPQFYYDGYVATLSQGSETYKVNGEYVDGLVSFRLKQGTYTMDVAFVGPTSYRVLRPVFYIGVGGTVIFAAAGYLIPYFIKKKKKDEVVELPPEPVAE
ncbi:MAG: hypothetical protein SPL80_04765 [Bacilli bacterium]|nr:hypothetical protein [Bacilli bacterium]